MAARSLYQFRGSSQNHHDARRSHRDPSGRCGAALPLLQPRPGRAATTRPPLPVPRGSRAGCPIAGAGEPGEQPTCMQPAMPGRRGAPVNTRGPGADTGCPTGL